MEDLLKKLKSKAPDLKPLLCIYSPEGMGKTTLAAGFWPKHEEVIFGIGSADPGLLDLMNRGFIGDTAHLVLDTWQDVKDFTKYLLTADHKYKYVAFDQLTDIQRMLFEQVAKDKFNGDMKEFLKFNDGSSHAVAEWETWWNDLSKLRAKMMVVCLAHAANIPFKNPEGQDYIRYELDLFKIESSFKRVDFRAVVKKCCSELGFINSVTEVTKGKALGGYMRQIAFERDAAYDAKNRWGLNEKIILGDNAAAAPKILRDAVFEAAKKAKSSTKEEK